MALQRVFLCMLPNFVRHFDDRDGCAACNFAHRWLNLQVGEIAKVMIVTDPDTDHAKFEARLVQSLDINGMKYACVDAQRGGKRCAKCSTLHLRDGCCPTCLFM